MHRLVQQRRPGSFQGRPGREAVAGIPGKGSGQLQDTARMKSGILLTAASSERNGHCPNC